MAKSRHEEFILRALQIAEENIQKPDGGPFGCVVVKNGKIISEGVNEVTRDNDPTAHAEISAIRAACKKLNTFQLTDCEIYTSCEPCPMCLGALYWARPKAIYFAATRDDAAKAGFDDELIYKEISMPAKSRSIKMQNIKTKLSTRVFDIWAKKKGKINY